ncbi:hypothetical protein GCM10007049_13980 [Echinicola pacifica]|uniref:Transcription elongation factor n=1 Tax=Echinicola pacifica TaxID=346377 RepID=A0A918PTN3_9BACT|nr:hypothetical protein [Echinicola pacifica]GGZ22376.1 hypothetical protein GCM10007049_13980 [Echinicola pacifica]
MDKIEIKKALIELEKNNLDHASMTHEDFLSQNQLKRDDVIDFDDRSHYKESEGLANSLDHQIHEHEAHLKTLENIPFTASTVVEPGAVICLNDRRMVVAVAKPSFILGGHHYLPISTDAPIYKLLEGKKKGDRFSFNGRDFTISDIY